MEKFECAIFCDYAFPSKDDKANLIGVFDTIKVESKNGYLFPTFFVLLKLVNLEKSKKISVFLESPDTKFTHTLLDNKDVTLTDDTRKGATIVMNAQLLVFDKEGDWKLFAQFENKEREYLTLVRVQFVS